MTENEKLKVVRGIISDYVRSSLVAQREGDKSLQKRLERQLVEICEMDLADDEWEYLAEFYNGDWEIKTLSFGRPRAPYRIQIIMEVYAKKSANPDWTWDHCCDAVHEKFAKNDGFKTWLKHENAKRKPSDQVEPQSYSYEVWKSKRCLTWKTKKGTKKRRITNPYV